MFSYEEAMKDSISYFNGDELAAGVFVGKYALRDQDGNILESNPDQMHRRLAKEFARIEANYPNPLTEEEIYNLFKNFEFVIPQGSPMSAIGNNYQIQSVSNCFVIESPKDSYSGILKTDQEQAQIMKRRGGVGFDISNIRPKGSKTKNAARTTDGIGVFMERFSNTCREVAQGGRRGALMLTISCHHPEIRTFINIKKDLKKVTGANISIRLTDEFMNAVKNKQKVELRWPVDSKNPSIKESVDAESLWNEIIEAAWSCAEPGILFWDNVLKYTPSDIYKDFGYETISTNPCAELVLSAMDSCRLMCINLMGFVKNKFTSSAQFDYDNYSKIVIQSQRLMDDMIDLEIEQIDKILRKIEIDPEDDAIKFYEKRLWENIRTACVNGRRTGLGITALGDTLAALGIKYGSPESIEVTEKIYKTLAINSYKSSCIMAGERGCFPVFDRSLEKDHPFISRIINSDAELLELYNTHGRRNIANTTTAPTGSVSTMTQTTSGIEPAYLIFYKRRKKINPNDVNSRVDFVDDMGDKWQEYPVFHHAFKSWMDINGYKLDESKNYKTADDLEFYKVSPYYQSTSNDIDWLASVEIQSVAQRWICHAISKTCNVPESCTKGTISEVYMKAWEHGCKGFTVYRDKCRAGVLISGGSNDSKKDTFNKTTAPKRPKSLDCDIYETKVGGEEFFVVVGKYQNTPYEIFAGKGKITHHKHGKLVKIKRGHYDLHTEDGVIENISSKFTDEEVVIARMTSLSLRHGSDIKFIVDQIEKAPGDMHSFGKSIGRILKKYIPNGEKVTGQSCDSCKSESLVREEGCVSCKSCGWSKCS